MDFFGKTQNIAPIQEQRDFTNPHIRFRRIRGKIVPIFNKKRIGQEISKTGEKAVLGAAAPIALFMAKKTKIGKSASSDISKFKWKSPSFLQVLPQDKFRTKVAKKSLSGASKLISSAFKNPGKLGLGVLGLGIGLKIIGDKMQIESPFGKDYTFIKDKEGLGS